MKFRLGAAGTAVALVASLAYFTSFNSSPRPETRCSQLITVGSCAPDSVRKSIGETSFASDEEARAYVLQLAASVTASSANDADSVATKTALTELAKSVTAQNWGCTRERVLDIAARDPYRIAGAAHVQSGSNRPVEDSAVQVSSSCGNTSTDGAVLASGNPLSGEESSQETSKPNKGSQSPAVPAQTEGENSAIIPAGEPASPAHPSKDPSDTPATPTTPEPEPTDDGSESGGSEPSAPGGDVILADGPDVTPDPEDAQPLDRPTGTSPSEGDLPDGEPESIDPTPEEPVVSEEAPPVIETPAVAPGAPAVAAG